MNVHDYIKGAAVATMVALAAFTVRREHKHTTPAPLLVTRVSEIIVTRVAAQEVSAPAPQKSSAVAFVHCNDEYLSQRRLMSCDDPRRKGIVEHERKVIVKPAPPVEPKALTPWSLPVSCATAKFYMTHFSEATLEKMRIAAGKPAPTALQKQQARECLAGHRPND